MAGDLISGLLRRDRAVVLTGLAALSVAAWAYLLLGSGLEMRRMGPDAMGMMAMRPEWTAVYTALIFAMWAVMMAAMMLPSAAPTILLVAALAQRGAPGPKAGAALFAAGYLAVWGGFSLVATLLQWGLDRAGLLSPSMAAGSRVLAGAVLLAAGIYQWTPLKDTCLRHCRSPVGFLVAHWRPGVLGMAATGMRHGAYCLGCCWMLMGLLFVGGLMNLAWVAAIALFVLAEKAAPWGGRMSRATGVLLMAGGAAVLIEAVWR
jgi:predicted metal-binding membrane protein